MKKLRLTKNCDSNEKRQKYQNNLILEYIELHWDKYDEYIAEFPEEEGYSPSAKQCAVYTIIREFLEWCAERGNDEPSEKPSDYLI